MWSLRSVEQEGDVLVTDDNLRDMVERKVPIRCVQALKSFTFFVDG